MSFIDSLDAICRYFRPVNSGVRRLLLMNKRGLLHSLAQKRKAARWPGYSQIGDYHDGAYECDFVSPYTKTASNVDADILVMLQDWSSAKSLQGPLDNDSVEYGFTRSFPTNKRLTELLQLHFRVGLENVYATNLFPFIKSGGISNYIPMRDLIRAAREFALPQVLIVRPRLVICLGLNTFNALRVASDHSRARRMHDAIASPFLIDGVRVLCQAHTGARGQSNRGRERVNQDWRTMAQSFSTGAKQIVRHLS